MADEILIQKIRFARQLVIVFKVFAIACSIVAVAGTVYSLSRGRPAAAVMGFLASAAATAATAYGIYLYRHIRQWLVDHEAPETDRHA